MPTYEYECGACGHRFEQFQPITATPLKTCPACRKRKVQRLIGTGAALIFKGSGFYATDYRSAAYKEAARKDSAPPPKETPSGAGASKACDGCAKKDSKACPSAKDK